MLACRRAPRVLKRTLHTAQQPRAFHGSSSLRESHMSGLTRATVTRALGRPAVTGSSRSSAAAAFGWSSMAALFGVSAVALAAEAKSSSSSGKPRRNAGDGVRNILIAVDASKTAQDAFDWALDNIVRPGDMVTILHVRYAEIDLVSPGEATGGFLPLTEPRSPEFFLQRSREITKKFSTTLDAKKIAYQTLLLEGDPREKLCEAASIHDAHMLILGSRGLSTFDRILLGSTSQHCATHAPCPVVIFR